MSNPIILGLDLSLTAPAAVVLGERWDPTCAFEASIDSRCWKAKLAEMAREQSKKADWPMVRWNAIAVWLIEYAVTFEVTHVFVEDYAYSAQATAGRALAELGGVVKFRMWRELNRIVHPVNMASARKTLLGRVPAKRTSGIAVKDFVNSKLAQMGARFGTLDEGDAFVIANHARSLLGLAHVGVGDENQRSSFAAFGG